MLVTPSLKKERLRDTKMNFNRVTNQSSVVRMLVNANPGINVNTGFCFSCSKTFHC